MVKLHSVLKSLALPVLCLLPFFIWTFFLQSPILISFARSVPLRALLMFVNIGDGATSDLYFTLLVALASTYLCYAISLWSKNDIDGIFRARSNTFFFGNGLNFIPIRVTFFRCL